MLHNTRYIVIYKDSPKDRNRYFGPFASDILAAEFCDRLPSPMAGGGKTWKALCPYNHDEISLASDVILRRRANDAYTTAAVIHHLQEGLVSKAA